MSIAFGVSWTDVRPIRRIAAIALVGAVLVSAGGMALHRESATVPVIVRSATDSIADAVRAVKSIGGRVDLPLPIIEGLRATVPLTLLGQLSASPLVKSVTPDGPVTMQSVDPSLGYDTGDDGSPYLVAKSIGAPQAWSAGYTGKGVDVALIDTGVAPVADLNGQFVNGPDLSAESQVDALRYLDTYGHGTFLAGIIAGRSPSLPRGAVPPVNSYTGIAPDARVVSVKVATYNGATDVSQVLAAIDWVVQHKNSGDLNIRVLNLSFGTDSTQDYRLDPLTYAAEVAWRNGIVVVAAGGNEGFGSARLNDPAYDPFVIAVGADNMNGNAGSGNDSVPDFSARGEVRKVDFVAPGKSIISLRDPGSYIDTNNPNGRVGTDFFRGSGTSQAAAVTSGAVAVLLQQRPGLTPDQVKYILRQSAAPMPGETSTAKGMGLLSVDRALNYATPSSDAAAQTFDPATGTGSLDAARGHSQISDNGTTLSGEQDIFGQPFSTADWASRSAALTSWDGGSWMGTQLTGTGWCSPTFTARSWTGSSWTGRSWTGSSWTGSSWTGSSWTGSSWTGSSWTGSSWTGSSWTGSSWTGSSWTGSSWTSNFWSGQGWGP